ncbi:MAG TPA: zinc ribbon domain-containing protein [Terriglobales bacterium]
MTQRSSHFRDEFGIIPAFMMVLAGIGFAAMVFLFLVAFPLVDPHAPPFPLRVFGAFVGGALVAVYLLLVGYVNQDAKRRDMGQLLWTLLVIFIPNGIGFLAYFLLRNPLVQFCTRCGGRVEKGFHYCARCGSALTPTCQHCGREVSRGYVVCPYCGKALGAASAND